MFRGTIKQWNLFEIRSGTPRVTTETSEMFIPQSLNLDLLGGINFQKGCYPGQEIVARVRYLGKIKQRMFKIKTESKSLVSAGSEIHHGTKKVGTVVISELSDNFIICLSVINSADSNSPLNIGDININLSLIHI